MRTDKELELTRIMLGMITKISALRAIRRKRLSLLKVRSQFESLGYDLSGQSDSELEAAVEFEGGSVEDLIPLTGRRSYWILRRISPDPEQLRARITQRTYE